MRTSRTAVANELLNNNELHENANVLIIGKELMGGLLSMLWLTSAR